MRLFTKISLFLPLLVIAFSHLALAIEDTIQIKSLFLSIGYKYQNKNLYKPKDFDSIFCKVDNNDLTIEFKSFEKIEKNCTPWLYTAIGCLAVGTLGTFAGTLSNNNNSWVLIPLGAGLTIDIVCLPFLINSDKHKAKSVKIYNSLIKNFRKSS